MGRLTDSMQLLALGLLSYADDEGLFLADPKLVNAAIRALKPHRNLPQMLAALQNVQWIEQRSHLEMGLLGKVCAFSAHQVINRPKPSVLTSYWNEATEVERSRIDHGSITAGREGKGREGKGVAGAREKREPKAPRKPSAQEACFSEMEDTRQMRCGQHGIDPGPRPQADVPRINTSINRAIALAGYIDVTATVNGAPHRHTALDQLINLYDAHFIGGEFGKDAGWPVSLFLSDGVIRRCLQAEVKANEAA